MFKKENIETLLKRYGADENEIKNFMQDLENFVEEKVEEVFDGDLDTDYEV